MEWKYIKTVDCMLTTEDIAKIENTSPAWVRNCYKEKLLVMFYRGNGLKTTVKHYLEFRERTDGYDLRNRADMRALARSLHLS